MDRRLIWFIALLVPVVVWSWIDPHDRFTWWLESLPALVGVALLVIFQKRFPLSSLVLGLLWWHCVVLVVGGHYTYAQVPLGEWAKEALGWTRNNYDKLGHFVQGFVPALLVREILIRTSPLRGSRWLGFLVVCVCLAFSAFYELAEWAVAVASGASADAFLGTQGDPWDTQQDMLWALIGATLAVTLLRRVHDRSIAAVRMADGVQDEDGKTVKP
jgi:putative membrane protein